MTMTKRIDRLERSAGVSGENRIDFIFIQGIVPSLTGPKETGKFHTYCLHPDCEAREHTPFEGETLDQMKGRLELEHKELAS